MSRLCAILLFLGIFARTVSALTDYQALQVVKGLADNFLSPHNAEVAATINSTIFAEDVTGTVDLSTNFDSRELSTEYLFGLFVRNDLDREDPSPFGVPLSYNVTHVVVQNGYVASSIILEFYYRALNKSFPIQIDSFIKVNEKREIQQYDAAFRRFGWATDVIVPQLIPHMARRLNITSNNATFILQQYLAGKVCAASTEFCQGEHQQYDSHDACMQFVTTIPLGEWYRMGENNLVCRHLHVSMLPLRPSVHCPHIGPTGGDMCVKRDYFEVVEASHFPQGWLAPKVVTPENALEVADIYAESGHDLDPLIEIAMGTKLHSWDPSIYATSLLCYFLGFYVSAHVVAFLFNRYTASYRELSLEHQRNAVVYTLNIMITTLALALQLSASPALRGEYSISGIEALRTAGSLISSLYIFELVYRLHMRLPLIAHHFLTIFAMSLTQTVFEITYSMSYMVSGFIWLFQATTEQPTFLGLLGYRMGWSRNLVSHLLKFAAIQTFILKSASAIALLVWWGLHQNYAHRPIDIAWTAMVFLIAIGLLLTQIWGSYVTYAIALRIDRQDRIVLRRPSPGTGTHKSTPDIFDSPGYRNSRCFLDPDHIDDLSLNDYSYGDKRHPIDEIGLASAPQTPMVQPKIPWLEDLMSQPMPDSSVHRQSIDSGGSGRSDSTVRRRDGLGRAGQDVIWRPDAIDDLERDGSGGGEGRAVGSRGDPGQAI